MARTKQTARASLASKQKRATKADVTSSDHQYSDMSQSCFEKLCDMLQDLEENKPRNFAMNGVVRSSPLPGLHLEGVGPVCMPVCSEQASKIVSAVSKSKGDHAEKMADGSCTTSTTTTTATTWELDAGHISLTNHVFEEKIQDIVSQACKSLGCMSTSNNNNVRASLSKLVLYGEGSTGTHCSVVKDVVVGSFATLIVQLPSVFQGNHLIVRHRSKSFTVKFDTQRAAHEIVYAAFYNECTHELTPLVSGHRLVLVYNLIWTPVTIPPSVHVNQETGVEIVSLLNQIEAGKAGVFGWALEHVYDEDTLASGMNGLKGRDLLVACVLNYANQQMYLHDRFEFFIARLQRSTTATSKKDGASYFSAKEMEMVEDTTKLSCGFTFDGVKCDMQTIHFNLDADLLLNFDYSYDDNLDEFWGPCVKEETDGPTGKSPAHTRRVYENFLFVILPPNQKYKLRRSSDDDEDGVPAKRRLMSTMEEGSCYSTSTVVKPDDTSTQNVKEAEETDEKEMRNCSAGI